MKKRTVAKFIFAIILMMAYILMAIEIWPSFFFGEPKVGEVYTECYGDPKDPFGKIWCERVTILAVKHGYVLINECDDDLNVCVQNSIHLHKFLKHHDKVTDDEQ